MRRSAYDADATPVLSGFLEKRTHGRPARYQTRRFQLCENYLRYDRTRRNDREALKKPDAAPHPSFAVIDLCDVASVSSLGRELQLRVISRPDVWLRAESPALAAKWARARPTLHRVPLWRDADGPCVTDA